MFSYLIHGTMAKVLKILYFMSIYVKYISWQIFNKIVENQDLYRGTKTT